MKAVLVENFKKTPRWATFTEPVPAQDETLVQMTATALSYRLWLSGRAPLASEADAVSFIQSVHLALRYNATPSLPLAAMHTAAGDVRRSTEYTNALLASGEAIETILIADRLVLLHRGIAPAVYTLRRRKNRPLQLSVNAERVLTMIQTDGHASSGDVRRFLGCHGQTRPDPGDEALAELQRELLVNRGPSSIPKNGIPYLSAEGYPYRIFATAHPAVVQTASRLTIEQAATSLIEAYLEAAVSVSIRKLASMFRLLLSAEELAAITSKRLERTPKHLSWR